MRDFRSNKRRRGATVRKTSSMSLEEDEPEQKRPVS